MKKILFTLILSTCSVFATERGWYAQGIAGLNFMEKVKEEGVELQIDPGYAVGASIGYRFQRYVRLEGEFIYRTNNFKKVKVDSLTIPLGGKVETFTFLANGILEFPIKDYATLHVGIGIGEKIFWGSIRAFGESKELEDNGLAYQGIAGITFPLSYNLNFAFEYRYLHREDDPDNHLLNIALTRSF